MVDRLPQIIVTPIKPNWPVLDRQKAVRWMKKLATCNRSIEEMKLRNDFMYYLVVNIQAGELQPPFTEPPPASPLPDIAHLLVCLFVNC